MTCIGHDADYANPRYRPTNTGPLSLIPLLVKPPNFQKTNCGGLTRVDLYGRALSLNWIDNRIMRGDTVNLCTVITIAYRPIAEESFFSHNNANIFCRKTFKFWLGKVLTTNALDDVTGT